MVKVIMVALWNRADHYIFMLWFLLSFFFPHLISAVADWMSTILDVYTWCGPSANLGLKRAARGSLKMQDAKDRQKIAILAPSHNFVGLYLRN